MYIVHTSFVSLETTFYLRVILQGFVDPIMQQEGRNLYPSPATPGATQTLPQKWYY